MPDWNTIAHPFKKPKRKGDGRKPARAGKTKQQARAEVIAKHAERTEQDK